MHVHDFLLASTNWKMEYEIDFRFSSFNEKWKMENGCSYSIFYFSFLLENENNGMYTDPTVPEAFPFHTRPDHTPVGHAHNHTHFARGTRAASVLL